jgi:hypothetical protein
VDVINMVRDSRHWLRKQYNVSFSSVKPGEFLDQFFTDNFSTRNLYTQLAYVRALDRL